MNNFLLANQFLVETPLLLDSVNINTLEQALVLVQQQLQLFANDPEFSQKMELVFGEVVEADSLQQTWLAGNFELLSGLEIRLEDELGGVKGAYSADRDTIYLSLELLVENQNNLEEIATIVLEELGHRLDRQLNLIDAGGDEGAIFSAVVRGEELSEQDLQRLKSEHDQTVIELDGEPVLIEQSSPALGGTDYYFDSNAGAGGNGSVENPWNSLAELQNITLGPGDRILLKRNSIFRERLEISEGEDGTAEAPIVIDAYGEGAKPIVSAGEGISASTVWTPEANGEFRYVLGPTSEFYTNFAVLARKAQGEASHKLISRGAGVGNLVEGTFSLRNESGQRVLYYKPLSDSEFVLDPDTSTYTSTSSFELSKRNFAIQVAGDWVEMHNLEAWSGNIGTNLSGSEDLPFTDGTITVTGNNFTLKDSRVAFGRAFGLYLNGADSLVDGLIAEHNSSSGIFLWTNSDRSTVRYSTSRYNGNVELGDLDRGGIGSAGDDSIIWGNTVHDNGNIFDTEGPRIAGDAAVTLFDNSNAVVAHNFIYNSARSAIGMSWTPNSFGHQIYNNTIANWNLVGLTGTLQTQAILGRGYGQTENSGVLRIEGNTIFSDAVDTTQIGIELGLPTSSDSMRNSSVQNNVVYMPSNVASDSVGIRITREYLFGNVVIDNNTVSLPQTNQNYFSFASEPINLPEDDSPFFATAAEFLAGNGYEANGSNQVATDFFDSNDPYQSVFNAGIETRSTPMVISDDSFTVVENTTFVVDLNSADDSDSEGNGLSYSLTGGADQGLFSLDSASGEIKFINAPDFENRLDEGADNIYNLLVTVTDSGGLFDVKELKIVVDDLVVENTAPNITSSATVIVAENQTNAIDVDSSDDFDSEGSNLTYSLTGAAADNGKFTIDANTGVITFNSAPDFELPGDDNCDNIYELQVTVTDSGGLIDVQDLAVTVINENEAPNAVENYYIQPKTENSTAGNVINDLSGKVDENGTSTPLAPDADFDPEGDSLTILLAATDTVSAFGGSIVWSVDGSFTYTPADRFAGYDRFDYSISDGNGGTSSASVFLEVQSQNQRGIEMANLTAKPDDAGIDQLTGLSNSVVTGTFDVFNDSEDNANLVQIMSVEVNYDQKANPKGKGRWVDVDSSTYQNYFWLDDGDGILNNGETLLEDLNPNKERFQIQVVFSDDVTIGYGSSFSNSVTGDSLDLPEPFRVNASTEIYGRDKLFGLSESFN